MNKFKSIIIITFSVKEIKNISKVFSIMKRKKIIYCDVVHVLNIFFLTIIN